MRNVDREGIGEEWGRGVTSNYAVHLEGGLGCMKIRQLSFRGNQIF